MSVPDEGKSTTPSGASPDREDRDAYPEYFSQDPDESIQVSQARLLLFETVKISCPQMLQALSQDVFPLFRGLVAEGCVFQEIYGPAAVSPYEHLELPTYNEAVQIAEQRKKLKVVFDVWARQFHVTEKWAKDGAIQTMGHWHRLPKARKSLEWNPFYTHLCIASAIGDPFEFRFQGWKTQQYSWPWYRKVIREKFETKLDEYEQQTRQRAESIGLVRSPRTFRPAHFEYFALHQFYGLSSGKIADRCGKDDPDGVDPSTILKGIKTAAVLLDWKHLRPTRNRKTR